MAKGKKRQSLSADKLFERALLPEDAQPYEVPGNWAWTKLGYLVNTSKEKTEDFIVNDQKYIGLEHIQKDSGIVGYGSSIELKSLKNVFHSGDVLYGKLRPYLNKHDIVGFDGVCSTDILVFKVGKLTNPKYVNYFFDTDRFIEYAVSNSKGINLPRVSEEIIREATTPLPPIAEQQRIVDRIETLFAKLDQAKELAQNALDTFETRKAAILHKAFTGKLTVKWREQHDLGMDSWEEKAVECLGDVKGGKRLPKGENLTNENTGFPYIKAGDLKQGTVLTDKIQYVMPKVQKIIKNYTVTAGDVYITIVGACIGDVGVIPEIMDGANLTENAAKITNLKCNANYLGICMSSNIVQQQIKNKIASATLGKLSLQNIKSLEIPTPLLAEQREIVRILDSLLEKEQMVKELVDVIDKIDLMKKAILASAFRGELGTNDPSEESSLELLKDVLATK